MGLSCPRIRILSYPFSHIHIESYPCPMRPCFKAFSYKSYTYIQLEYTNVPMPSCGNLATPYVHVGSWKSCLWLLIIEFICISMNLSVLVYLQFSVVKSNLHQLKHASNWTPELARPILISKSSFQFEAIWMEWVLICLKRNFRMSSSIN